MRFLLLLVILAQAIVVLSAAVSSPLPHDLQQSPEAQHDLPSSSGAQHDLRLGREPRHGHMTIEVENRLGHSVQYLHTHNAGAATPVQGAGGGVLQKGRRLNIVVPAGWAGNIAFVQNGGGRAIVGDESLIEGSHMDQGQGHPKFDINVSYVNGFSVPIVCSCEAGVIAGCNANLWKGACPDNNGKGSCRNPSRHGGAHPAFFEPCRSAAYVYPADNEANTGNGACNRGKVTCCIGPKCPRNTRQRS